MSTSIPMALTWGAVRRYHASGFSLIPCLPNKQPAIAWQDYQNRRPSSQELRRWFINDGYQSIGLLGGAISGNVVFIDMDGIGAIRMFAKAFPKLCERTKSVLTGSQKGIHLYVRVDEIPNNINVRVDGVGGFEIRGTGQYVIAPPSPHPSGYQYQLHRDNPILYWDDIQHVYDWMAKLREQSQHKRTETIKEAARPQYVPADYRKQAFLSKVVSEELARVQTASEGNRNDSLFYAGLRLANYAAGGELNWNEMSLKLMDAGRSAGLASKETEKTIQSAWNIGRNSPKTVK